MEDMKKRIERDDIMAERREAIRVSSPELFARMIEELRGLGIALIILAGDVRDSR